jgi:hypothetical protein
MLASIFGFLRTPIAWKWKFKAIYKNTRMTKLKTKFQVMIVMNVPSMMHWIVGGIRMEMGMLMLMKFKKFRVKKPLTLDEVRKHNKKQKFNVYEQFSTMAKNSITMLQQFVETNALFINMDAQIRCLIDKIIGYIKCEPMNHSSHFDP